MMIFLTIDDLVIIALLPPELRRLKLEILQRGERQR